jgi:hypothetical protein
VKTRYQLFVGEGLEKARTSYADITKTIWKEDGFKGFFRGLSASYVGCIEGGIQWVVYENIKKRIAAWKEIHPSKSAEDNKISAPELFLAAVDSF